MAGLSEAIMAPVGKPSSTWPSKYSSQAAPEGHFYHICVRYSTCKTEGGSLKYSSFHDWFMPALCDFLQEVLKRALEDLEHENYRLQGCFEQFR